MGPPRRQARFPGATPGGSVFAMTSMNAGIPQTFSGGSGTINVDALKSSIDASFDETMTRLKALVAIPGIAWPSFDPAELERSAEAVAALVRESGFGDVQILRCDKADG